MLKSELLLLIRNSFPHDLETGLMSLQDGDAKDMYEESKAATIVSAWKDVPDIYLDKYQDGLSYLDDESLLFYTPAILSWIVRNITISGSLLPDQFLYVIAQKKDWWREVLTESQRACLRMVYGAHRDFIDIRALEYLLGNQEK